MTTPLPLAHAGLQDCVDAHMNCMPGFGWFLVGFAVVAIGCLVALIASMCATVAIVFAKTGVLRGLAWCIAAWAVPLLGAAAWFAYERRLSNSTADGTAPHSTPEPE